jgi:SAM-dependent methyltransferase
MAQDTIPDLAPPMDEVRDFFERSAESYRGLQAGMAPYHRVTAGRIERGLAGDVLSLGGVWAQASERLPERVRLVVADLSLAMLKHGGGPAGPRVACDGQRPSFRAGSFDHLVLPLMLHHVTGRTFASAQDGARLVLAQVRPLLRPGGRLWISDFCTSGAVYLLQRCLAPFTRRLLGVLHEPLVVMHSEAFYRAALAGGGWRDIFIEPIRTDEAGRLDWVRPVIAAPWLRVPRFAYPLRPTLITAVAP